MLQLRGIKKEYITGTQVVNALKGLTVDFRKNEFVSVLGPSGCGKTTLMNIVGGLDKYSNGDLIINGRSTKRFCDSDWDNYRNKKIGFVFQSYNLIPHLNVFGNVEIALTISGISKEERKKRTMNALEQVGLLEQINQKPNQLSGGQMQRVAIARALVNNPEILLADEPTGALDSKTSVQILELIKEIAKDRLVIMVTHNPELAKEYSTRIIKMVDGLITDDSMPYHAESDTAFNEAAERERAERLNQKKNNKSSMTYKTALSLSGKNLIKKKGRTILTAIAGSIGIIGIALILALSSGMNNFIAQMQRDTLASNPITITTTGFDMNQAMTAMGRSETLEKYPKLKEIYVEKAITMADITTKNNINDEYINFIKTKLNSSWYNDITYKTGLNLTVYGIKSGQSNYSNLTENSSSNSMAIFGGSSEIWQMLLDSDFIKEQYDVLEGDFPSDKNEIAIIVDQTNKIAEEILVELGIKAADDDVKQYEFSDVLQREYKIVSNDLMYEKVGSKFIEKSPLDIDYSKAETIKITSILRIKESVDSGVLSTGIGYTKELYQWLQTENGGAEGKSPSEIVQFMRDNPTINPHEGTEYESSLNATKEEQRERTYRRLGGELMPNEINIYPVSFDSKDLIKTELSNYNIDREKEDKVIYTDMSELLGAALSQMVNIVTSVLIGFTAISLVVSSIMISIITYISVLERTKEIGILRSIGARKKDVTRVFNAETIIIGFVAGLLGVIVALLLCIPINFFIAATIEIKNIASLGILHAIILIVISTALTLFSGLIPAGKAAQQDPVTALRTE